MFCRRLNESQNEIMNSKVIDLVVNNDLCIGCGLCVYKCPEKALEMCWDDYGFWVPTLNAGCKQHGDCLDVCPFNPKPSEAIRTESELSNIFQDAPNYHLNVGKFFGLYAGYSKEYRLTSSSGGIATFLLVELLEKGFVDYVFSVRTSSNGGTHYEYAVSQSRQELISSAKTKYYPVDMSVVLSKIEKLKGKIAVVGVACFIKAIRLAQYNDPQLRERITFLVGIICGGIKSRFFSEYLAEKAGVSSLHCQYPKFRVKNLKSTAADYSFSCIDGKSNEKKTIRMRPLGDMWGSGLFKSNACDFCDDVTTELADISVGDAWIPPFNQDGRGTSIVVSRSDLAERILTNGITDGKLELETLSLERFMSSQSGSFTHRQQALTFRINQQGKSSVIPPKRFDKGKIPLDVKMIQLQRRKVRRRSLDIWKNTGNSVLFDQSMKADLHLLRKLTQIYHLRRKVLAKLNISKR